MYEKLSLDAIIGRIYKWYCLVSHVSVYDCESNSLHGIDNINKKDDYMMTSLLHKQSVQKTGVGCDVSYTSDPSFDFTCRTGQWQILRRGPRRACFPL